MNWPAACALVIPCFNEERRITDVIQNARCYLPTVFVVDDGSHDATGSIAVGAGAKVLKHPRNRGKGAALATGLAAARTAGFQWALIMDGDGQHDAADIPRFFLCASQTGATLIIGNRMAKPDAMPRIRRWVNFWMSRRISRRLGRSAPDTQCGFRLVYLPAWEQFSFATRGFEVESEMLHKFATAGEPIAFVPVTVIYGDEQSKIRPFRDTIRWFRWWWGSPCSPAVK